MHTDQQTHAIARRIEVLVQELAALPADPLQQRAQELVRLLLELYGAGLTRILRLIELQDTQGARIVDALVADDLIASLLLLHDLHPQDAATRIRRGLQRVGALARASITLLGVRDGSVALEVQPNGGSYSLSPADLKRLIEGVVQSAVPDVSRIDIEGLGDAAAASLIQLEPKRLGDRKEELPIP